MQYGCPALNTIDDITANRDEALQAARRIAARDRTARLLPAGSRDDLAIVIACLQRIDELVRFAARPEIAAMYQQKIGKR